MDKDGVDIFNEEYGCENEQVVTNYLLLRSKSCYYWHSTKFKWNQKYVESIIKQRKILIERFNKYDEIQNVKMTFLFDPISKKILKSQ